MHSARFFCGVPCISRHTKRPTKNTDAIAPTELCNARKARASSPRGNPSNISPLTYKNTTSAATIQCKAIEMRP